MENLIAKRPFRPILPYVKALGMMKGNVSIIVKNKRVKFWT
jgi:hypothetical protein